MNKDSSLNTWAAVATILALIVAILALFRDVFDFRLPQPTSPSPVGILGSPQAKVGASIATPTFAVTSMPTTVVPATDLLPTDVSDVLLIPTNASLPITPTRTPKPAPTPDADATASANARTIAKAEAQATAQAQQVAQASLETATAQAVEQAAVVQQAAQVALSGEWRGTTSQGELAYFEIKDDDSRGRRIVNLMMFTKAPDDIPSSCPGAYISRGKDSFGHGDILNAFSGESFSYSTTEELPEKVLTWSIAGNFHSTSEASGSLTTTVQPKEGDCIPYTLDITWSVRKL